MKKNLFKSALTMCALGAIFAACSNEGNEVPEVKKGEKKTVFMKLDLKPQTRATEDKLDPAVPADAKVPVNQLDIFFYEGGSGNIQKHLTISSTTTPSITDLTNGARLTEIPSAADKVLVRGNVPASVVLPANGPISAVENLMVDITTQNDKNNILLGHIAKNLSEWHTGDPNIFGTVTTAIDGDKYAEVELEPAVARIEFEGLQTTTVTAITGFDLKGIYQNNFFTKLKMGDGSSDDKKDYGINPANYALGQGLFTGINKEKLFDEFTPVYSATGSPLAVSPAGGADKRWVYHIYENGATDANDQLQLIFKLENLQPSATIPSPQFLTVRGFKNSSGQLVEIQKGKIYTVSKSDFTFNESNLTTVPNTNAVGVWLKVTVKPWEVVNVKPNL